MITKKRTRWAGDQNAQFCYKRNAPTTVRLREMGRSVCTPAKPPKWVAPWWRGVVVNLLVSINEVTTIVTSLIETKRYLLHWTRLLPGWVTICWQVNHLGM